MQIQIHKKKAYIRRKYIYKEINMQKKHIHEKNIYMQEQTYKKTYI